MSRVPQRIQRKRERGWRMPPGAVYVGRSSRWGNPWIAGINRDDFGGPDFALTREEAIGLYRQMWTTFPRRIIAADLAPLRGRDLACWCPLTRPCHADVLLELANE